MANSTQLNKDERLRIAEYGLIALDEIDAMSTKELNVMKSVITASVQCAAVEGSYPSSLSHLESHYGLVINHDDYIVNYEWLADNVPPSVTVVPR